MKNPIEIQFSNRETMLNPEESRVFHGPRGNGPRWTQEISTSLRISPVRGAVASESHELVRIPGAVTAGNQGHFEIHQKQWDLMRFNQYK